MVRCKKHRLTIRSSDFLVNMAASADRDFSQYMCHSCHQMGHIAKHCPERSEESRRTLCAWCGTHGHAEAACFKRRSGMPRTPPAAAAAAGAGAAAYQHRSHSRPQQQQQQPSAHGHFAQANLFERVPGALNASVIPLSSVIAAAASGGGDWLCVPRQPHDHCCA